MQPKQKSFQIRALQHEVQPGSVGQLPRIAACLPVLLQAILIEQHQLPAVSRAPSYVARRGFDHCNGIASICRSGVHV